MNEDTQGLNDIVESHFEDFKEVEVPSSVLDEKPIKEEKKEDEDEEIEEDIEEANDEDEETEEDDQVDEEDTEEEKEDAEEGEEDIPAPAQFKKSEKEAFAKLPMSLKREVNRVIYETRKELAVQSKAIKDIASSQAVNYALDNKINVRNLVDNSIQWMTAIKEDPTVALDFLEEAGVDVKTLISKDEIDQTVAYKVKENEAVTEANSFLGNLVNQGLSKSQIEEMEQDLIPIVTALRAKDKNASHSTILNKALKILKADDSLSYIKVLTSKDKKQKIEKEGQRVQKAKDATKTLSGSTKSTTRNKGKLKGDAIIAHYFRDL